MNLIFINRVFLISLKSVGLYLLLISVSNAWIPRYDIGSNWDDKLVVVHSDIGHEGRHMTAMELVDYCAILRDDSRAQCEYRYMYRGYTINSYLLAQLAFTGYKEFVGIKTNSDLSFAVFFSLISLVILAVGFVGFLLVIEENTYFTLLLVAGILLVLARSNWFLFVDLTPMNPLFRHASGDGFTPLIYAPRGAAGWFFLATFHAFLSQKYKLYIAGILMIFLCHVFLGFLAIVIFLFFNVILWRAQVKSCLKLNLIIFGSACFVLSKFVNFNFFQFAFANALEIKEVMSDEIDLSWEVLQVVSLLGFAISGVFFRDLQKSRSFLVSLCVVILSVILFLMELWVPSFDGMYNRVDGFLGSLFPLAIFIVLGKCVQYYFVSRRVSLLCILILPLMCISPPYAIIEPATLKRFLLDREELVAELEKVQADFDQHLIINNEQSWRISGNQEINEQVTYPIQCDFDSVHPDIRNEALNYLCISMRSQ